MNTEDLMLTAITKRANHRGEWATTYRTLAAATPCARSTSRKALARLVDEGFVEVVPLAAGGLLVTVVTR